MLRPAIRNGRSRSVLRGAGIKCPGDKCGGRGGVLFGGSDGHCGQELLAEIRFRDLRRPIRGRGEISRGPLAERMHNQFVALTSGRQRPGQFHRGERFGAGGLVSRPPLYFPGVSSE